MKKSRDPWSGKSLNLRESGYQPEIDGLRAIAVLAVIANHFHAPLLAHGYLGVDIFFVISGYVITKSLQGYTHTSVFASVREFYSRRINRLMPVLLVCVVVTCLFAMMFTPSPKTTLITGGSSLFGLSNLYLFRISANYFGDSASLNFFTHTWSLGVEEQFYFVIPLLFFFLSLYVRASTRLFIQLMVVLSVISLSCFLYYHDRIPNLAFFMMPFRFWELAAGVLVFYLTRQGSADNWLSRIDIRYSVGLLLLVLSIPIIPQGLATVFAVALTGFILVQLSRNTPGRGVLLLYPLSIIGLMSYSLYLWHWSILVLARWTVGVSLTTAPFLLFAMFGLAYLSYTQIEQRFRVRSGHRYFNRIALVSVFSSLFLAAGVLSIATQQFVDPYLGTRNEHLQQSSNITSLGTSQHNRHQMIAQLADLRARCNMTPEFAGEGAFNRAEGFRQSSFDACLERSSTPRIILLGDSFSNVVAEHLMYIAEKTDHEFRLLYGYECPFPLDKKNVEFSTLRACKVDPQLVQQAVIENLKPGDIVVLRLSFQSTVYANLPTNDVDRAVQAYDEELETLVAGIRGKGAGFLLIGTNASIPGDSTCNLDEWFNRYQCESQGTVNIDLAKLPRNQLAKSMNVHFVDKFSAKGGATRVLDPFVHLCGDDSNTCPLIEDGKVYMRDTFHLSQVAVDDMYEALLNEIESLGSALSSNVVSSIQ